jgi:hypothetical protein
MRGISDPSWKSGPTYDTPTDSEHALDVESGAIDIDGVGVDEAEQVDGTPICTTMESFSCLRDGCDATERRRHVYVLEDVSDTVVAEISEQIDWVSDKTIPTDDDIVEYIAENVKVVDYDESPVLGFGQKFDLYLPARLTITDEAHGPCYGHEEPDPEPYGL